MTNTKTLERLNTPETAFEALNQDLSRDAVKVLWTGHIVTLWHHGKILASFTVDVNIRRKIVAWCVTANYRCPQIHDGRIWL